LAACNQTLTIFDQLKGQDPTQTAMVSDFLNLTFSKRWRQKFLLRCNVRIAVVGNEARNKRKFLERYARELSDYSGYFNVELVFQPSDMLKADAVFRIWSLPGGKDFNQARINNFNFFNRMTNKLFGHQTLLKRNFKFDRFVTGYRPYPDGYFKPGGFWKPCYGHYYFKDYRKQKKYYWNTRPNREGLKEVPDFAVFHVFTGFRGPAGRAYLRKLGIDVAKRPVVRFIDACLFEELTHIVTFWRDTKTNTSRRFLFNITKRSSARAKNKKAANKVDFARVDKNFLTDKSYVLKLLKFCSNPELRAGMTRNQVKNTLK
jgi:hypothetical protein